MELLGTSRRPHVLLTTAPLRVGMAPRCVPCARPGVINVLMPAGYGLITGGEYIVGGPFPGVDACSQQPYRITATNSSGSVREAQNVPGGHSYVLIVPAGRYTLRAATGGCRGKATVRAGQSTHADTTCFVP